MAPGTGHRVTNIAVPGLVELHQGWLALGLWGARAECPPILPSTALCQWIQCWGRPLPPGCVAVCHLHCLAPCRLYSPYALATAISPVPSMRHWTPCVHTAPPDRSLLSLCI